MYIWMTQVVLQYAHTFEISMFHFQCQKWDLIETETYKSQMYGHDAGQPVSSIILILIVKKRMYLKKRLRSHNL